MQAAASVYTISVCRDIRSKLDDHARDMQQATADIKNQLAELKTSVDSLHGALLSGLASIHATIKDEFEKSRQFELLKKLEMLQMHLVDFLDGAQCVSFQNLQVIV